VSIHEYKKSKESEGKGKTKKTHLILAILAGTITINKPNAMPNVRWLHTRCLCRCARLGEVHEGLDEEGAHDRVLHDLKKCE
jgi:hypothetical protein